MSNDTIKDLCHIFKSEDMKQYCSDRSVFCKKYPDRVLSANEIPQFVSDLLALDEKHPNASELKFVLNVIGHVTGNLSENEFILI